MISDHVANIQKYEGSIPFARELSEYLRHNDIVAFKVGKYPVKGNSLFLLIQEYATKNPGEKKWESHRKYVDIQVVLRGKELIGYSHAGDLAQVDGNDPDADIIFYEDSSTSSSTIVVPANHFCVFFPDDAHKPGLTADRMSIVNKAVFKAAIV